MKFTRRNINLGLSVVGVVVFLLLLGLKSAPITLPQNILGVTNIQAPASSPDASGRETVTVTKVIDGDTIELSDGRTLRYIGIDTPETKHPTKGVQCFGQEASQRNRELVIGKQIQLEKDVSETDRYGRLLRYVWLEGELLNKKLVAEGYAFASSYPPDVARQTELREAQTQAREQQLGLWKSCPVEDDETSSLNQQSPSPWPSPSPGCVIKGNISDGGKLYHLPNCSAYNSVKIDENKGERWFCTEQEATSSGWVKVNGC